LENVLFDAKHENVDQFSKALAHLCYNNLDFTRQISKKILSALAYSNNETIGRNLVIVE